jgi:excisionase family DNA binding protein
MKSNETPTKVKWSSIREAAEYLDVGEPPLYRWMREGKTPFRKVGDSTRFWQAFSSTPSSCGDGTHRC